MKNPKAEDRRVRRTKAALRRGLVELMTTKPLGDITVKELAEQSDVSRGTFYKYYTDIAGMCDTIKTDIAAELREIVDKHVDGESDFPRDLFVNIYSFLGRNSDFRVLFMSSSGNGSFVDSIVSIIRHRFEDEFKASLRSLDLRQLDYFFSYISSGCIAMFGVWIAHGMKETPEEMADITVKLMVGAVSAIS